MDRYVEELKKQLEFLKRSCDTYDCEGNEDEAIRIAVILRTLLRDTRSSTSLLTLLNQKDDVKLLSSLMTVDESFYGIQITTSYFAHIMMTGEGQKPYLSQTNKKKNILVSEWLKEIVLVLDGVLYSREDIIVTAANKDGGAHVEKKLNQKAKLLKKSFGSSSWGQSGRRITIDLDNHHYINLRQFAFEILHSEDLFRHNNLSFQQHTHIKSYQEYLNEGIKYFEEKRYYKAIESYKKAIQRKPKSCEEALTNLGHSLEEIEEIDEARETYLKAIQLNENYIAPWFNISRLSIKEKRYDLAVEAYERILQVDKKHKETNYNFRVLLNHLGLPNELIYQYNNVFSKSENETYMYYLAVGLLNNEMYKEALVCFKRLYEILQDDITLCNLGVVNLQLSNIREAEEIFLNLSNAEPTHPHICINLLEYKLIYNNSLSDQFVNTYKTKFPNDKQAFMLIDMLSILIKKNNNSFIKEDISYFSKEYKNLKINYDLKDIESWINQTENNSLMKILSFFKTFNS